jgi:diphthamide synthase (EF-2-diphthine--ammonia ligase)
VLRQHAELQVVGLVTTVNEAYGRVAMHAVREVLLERQAAAVGLPLWRVPIPSPCSNARYEEAMGRVVSSAVAEGIAAMAFGDLFLEEIRRYREAQLAGTGLEPLFPLWGLPTDALARTMVGGGLRARITCVDPAQLPARFAGREFDEALLASLPPGVDPCGERGEFHTFAYAGPMFRGGIGVKGGEVVERDGFVFADLQPESDERAS